MCAYSSYAPVGSEMESELGVTNAITHPCLLAFAALGITSQVSCSASTQPDKVTTQTAVETPATASATRQGSRAPVAPPPPPNLVAATAPTWESDTYYAKCVHDHATRAERDRCYIQTKRGREPAQKSQPAKTEPTTPQPAELERASTSAVADPAHPVGRASSGWRLVHRVGPTQQIEIEYRSAADLAAALRQRMELELQSAGNFRAALRHVPAGGELLITFASSSLYETDAANWVVVLKAGQRVIKRHRGDRGGQATTSDGFIGLMLVPIPRFVPPLDIHVVPPAGNFRLDYRLDAVK